MKMLFQMYSIWRKNIKESPYRDKLGGKKTIEYVMIPRREGRITIPGVNLTYFDLKDKKWKTKRSKTIQLSVTPNNKSVSTSIGLSKEDIKNIIQEEKRLQWKK